MGPAPKPFRDAASYQDLLDANLLFLRGELKTTPYSYGPLEPDSNVDKLVALNVDLHLFTHDGQSSLTTGGRQTLQVEQRSYVSFLLEKTRLREFVVAMEGAPVYYKVHTTGSGELVFHTFPARSTPNQHYVLTRSRHARARHGSTAWDDHTNAWVDGEPEGGWKIMFKRCPKAWSALDGCVDVLVASALPFGAKAGPVVEDVLLAHMIRKT